MKTFRVFIGIAVLILTTSISAPIPVSAQELTAKEQRKVEKTIRQQKKELYSKPEKMVRKEANKLKKEGWQSMDIPMEKQLQATWEKIYQYDQNGYPKYIYKTTQASAQSYSAAQMEAENIAKIRIASDMAASVASLTDVALANSEISTSEAATVSEVVENAKVLVAGKLGRVITSTCIYKKDSKTYTVRTTVLYDMKQAAEMTIQAVKDELKKKSKENNAKLEDLIGMNNLINEYERNNTDEE